MGEKVAVRHGRVPEQYVGIGQALLEPRERDFADVRRQGAFGVGREKSGQWHENNGR